MAGLLHLAFLLDLFSGCVIAFSIPVIWCVTADSLWRTHSACTYSHVCGCVESIRCSAVQISPCDVYVAYLLGRGQRLAC